MTETVLCDRCADAVWPKRDCSDCEAETRLATAGNN
jgi:hypothetical protein